MQTYLHHSRIGSNCQRAFQCPKDISDSSQARWSRLEVLSARPRRSSVIGTCVMDMARILDCTVRSRRVADRYARVGVFLLWPLQNPSATSAGISALWFISSSLPFQYSTLFWLPVSEPFMPVPSDSRSFPSHERAPWHFPLCTLIGVIAIGPRDLPFSSPSPTPAGGGRRPPQNRSLIRR